MKKIKNFFKAIGKVILKVLKFISNNLIEISALGFVFMGYFLPAAIIIIMGIYLELKFGFKKLDTRIKSLESEKVFKRATTLIRDAIAENEKENNNG